MPNLAELEFEGSVRPAWPSRARTSTSASFPVQHKQLPSTTSKHAQIHYSRAEMCCARRHALRDTRTSAYKFAVEARPPRVSDMEPRECDRRRVWQLVVNKVQGTIEAAVYTGEVHMAHAPMSPRSPSHVHLTARPRRTSKTDVRLHSRFHYARRCLRGRDDGEGDTATQLGIATTLD